MITAGFLATGGLAATVASGIIGVVNTLLPVPFLAGSLPVKPVVTDIFSGNDDAPITVFGAAGAGPVKEVLAVVFPGCGDASTAVLALPALAPLRTL